MQTEIVVALISATGVICAAVLPAVLIHKLRKANSTDHATVLTMLIRIEQKLKRHLEDHENGRFGRTGTKADEKPAN
jgi:hypothetical protein